MQEERKMRFIFKVCASIYLVIIFTVVSLLTIIFYRDKKTRLERISKNTALFSPILLKIMGISYKVNDHSPGKGLTGKTLVAANHLSYVDVFVLAAVRPMLFISSVELSGTLLVGHISRMGGTVFVERRKYRNLRGEIKSIASVLNQGFTVVLFPEATTSDGTALLPFRPSLFEAAIISQADITPVCIRYLKINGRPLNMRTKDHIVFHGGVRLIPHMIRLFSHHDIEVEINVLEKIPVSGRSRKDLVRKAQQVIEDCYLEGLDWIR